MSVENSSEYLDLSELNLNLERLVQGGLSRYRSDGIDF